MRTWRKAPIKQWPPLVAVAAATAAGTVVGLIRNKSRGLISTVTDGYKSMSYGGWRYTSIGAQTNGGQNNNLTEEEEEELFILLVRFESLLQLMSSTHYLGQHLTIIISSWLMLGVVKQKGRMRGWWMNKNGILNINRVAITTFTTGIGNAVVNGGFYDKWENGKIPEFPLKSKDCRTSRGDCSDLFVLTSRILLITKWPSGMCTSRKE